MTIGEVAKKTGLSASAIRFYERSGLLPRPVRISGQRRYDAAILDRIAVLERAKACGFSLKDIAILFNDQGRHSTKWRQLADKKIAELEVAQQRITAMKDLLTRTCQCGSVGECGHRIRATRRAVLERAATVARVPAEP